MIQHGVRIKAVFASLQQGEHMVKSTCILHTSSHPDKNNNSANRIISKRRGEKRSKGRYFSLLRVEWCFHILQRTTCNPASFQPSRAKTTILHTELILLQEIFKKYYNYKVHPMQINTRHLPVTAPVSPSILHGRIRLPAPLQHRQASSNSTQQKQHSKRQPASKQLLQKFPGKLHRNPLGITEFYQEK